jgi:hypothetical protein
MQLGRNFHFELRKPTRASSRALHSCTKLTKNKAVFFKTKNKVIQCEEAIFASVTSACGLALSLYKHTMNCESDNNLLYPNSRQKKARKD